MARDVIAADPAWGVVRGFVDDSPDLRGKTIASLPLLGATNDARRLAPHLLLGVGYPETKAGVVGRLGSDADWVTLIHPRASIGNNVSIHRGSFIQAGCVLTCDIRISEFVTVNCGVTVSHDVVIGRFATLSPGAHIGGNVTVGEGAFVGIGASIKQGVTIGEWSTIGAGAAVIADVAANEVVVGVPARTIKTRNPNWHFG